MSEFVKNLFDAISQHYDFLNHLMSLHSDSRWRKKAIASINKNKNSPLHVLDLCAGTCAFGQECAKQFPYSTIVASDFSERMLNLGKEKIKKAGLANRFEFVCSDALHMPFADQSFDLVICGYGVRNLDDKQKALKEIHRVLKKQGQLLVLDFFRPTSFLNKIFYNTFTKFLIPVLGGLVSGNKSAYCYLRDSIGAFLTTTEFNVLLEQSGYKLLNLNNYILSISTSVLAEKTE